MSMTQNQIDERIAKYNDRRAEMKMEKDRKRNLVKDLFRNGLRVQYLRGPQYEQLHYDGTDRDGLNDYYKGVISRGNPRGVVVSVLYDGSLYFGWSLLNTDEDSYDRDDGIIRAVARLKPLSFYLNNININTMVRRKIADMVKKDVLYFKG